MHLVKFFKEHAIFSCLNMAAGGGHFVFEIKSSSVVGAADSGVFFCWSFKNK